MKKLSSSSSRNKEIILVLTVGGFILSFALYLETGDVFSLLLPLSCIVIGGLLMYMIPNTHRISYDEHKLEVYTNSGVVAIPLINIDIIEPRLNLSGSLVKLVYYDIDLKNKSILGGTISFSVTNQEHQNKRIEELRHYVFDSKV